MGRALWHGDGSLRNSLAVELRKETSLSHKDTTMKKANPSPNQRESALPLKLAVPARRALAGVGIVRLKQLAKLSEAEVKQLHGIGPKALAVLRRALAAKGLSFKVSTTQ